MVLSPAGDIVQRCWLNLPRHFLCLELDAFVIMPNHLHGIIVVGAQFIAPDCPNNQTDISSTHLPQGAINHAPTLGNIVRNFKALSTRTIRRDHDAGFAWQRNYYEHVIRNEEGLKEIREYIVNNPANWDRDEDNIG